MSKIKQKKKYIKHIVQEGARYHVISYHGINYDGKLHSVQKCNCPNCEINKEWDMLVEKGIIKGY